MFIQKSQRSSTSASASQATGSAAALTPASCSTARELGVQRTALLRIQEADVCSGAQLAALPSTGLTLQRWAVPDRPAQGGLERFALSITVAVFYESHCSLCGAKLLPSVLFCSLLAQACCRVCSLRGCAA